MPHLIYLYLRIFFSFLRHIKDDSEFIASTISSVRSMGMR